MRKVLVLAMTTTLVAFAALRSSADSDWIVGCCWRCTDGTHVPYVGEPLNFWYGNPTSGNVLDAEFVWTGDQSIDPIAHPDLVSPSIGMPWNGADPWGNTNPDGIPSWYQVPGPTVCYTLASSQQAFRELGAHKYGFWVRVRDSATGNVLLDTGIVTGVLTVQPPTDTNVVPENSGFAYEDSNAYTYTSEVDVTWLLGNSGLDMNFMGNGDNPMVVTVVDSAGNPMSGSLATGILRIPIVIPGALYDARHNGDTLWSDTVTIRLGIFNRNTNAYTYLTKVGDWKIIEDSNYYRTVLTILQ